MHIFITGASGFVGGAETRELVAMGHKVPALADSGFGSDCCRICQAQLGRNDQ